MRRIARAQQLDGWMRSDGMRVRACVAEAEADVETRLAGACASAAGEALISNRSNATRRQRHAIDS